MPLYIIKLEQGKYFIGKSDITLENPLDHYRYKGGCDWTIRYRPIDVLATIKDILLEEKYFKELSQKYGEENVRSSNYQMTNKVHSDTNSPCPISRYIGKRILIDNNFRNDIQNNILMPYIGNDTEDIDYGNENEIEPFIDYVDDE
jgi:hypothetical protein